MLRRKKVTVEMDYLMEKMPCRNAFVAWSVDHAGIVTLEMKNIGWANRVAQIILGKPRVTYIHLDEFGSYIWIILDGEKSIREIGTLVDSMFGKKAYPLYSRLIQFLKILNSYHFIS